MPVTGNSVLIALKLYLKRRGGGSIRKHGVQIIKRHSRKKIDSIPLQIKRNKYYSVHVHVVFFDLSLTK